MLYILFNDILMPAQWPFSLTYLAFPQHFAFIKNIMSITVHKIFPVVWIFVFSSRIDSTTIEERFWLHDMFIWCVDFYSDLMGFEHTWLNNLVPIQMLGIAQSGP